MPRPLHLLLLEDNSADAELNERVLRRAGLEFESRRVETREQFLAALDDFQPDAILADFGLPHFDGLNALELARTHDAALPFIFVTGALGEEGAVELLRNGANDYILKDRLTRLPDALTRALEAARQGQALHRAEQNLRESEARFHALFEHMRSGVCIYEAIEDGRDFIIRDLNHSVEYIEGIEASALIGRRLTEAFPGVAECGFLSVFERVWRTGRAEHIPPRLYRDQRLQGWRENFIYRLPHGEVVAVYDDVTERRTLELALEESRERLELALEGSELGLWDWRVQTGETQFNERWAAMLGYRLAELEPTSMQTWQDLCHPEDLALAKQRLESHFRGEVPYFECEFRLRHKDGHWVWILDRGKVVEWGADRRPVRMAGTHLDITERKRIEDTLHQLSLAVEQSPTSIVITDLDARIEYANPSFSRVSGYTPEEAIGQNPRLLQSGQTPSKVYEDLWATLQRGEVWRGELYNKRKNGELYVELATISPVRQPDGRVTHYLAVKEDITDLKCAQEELDRYRQHLEELVETRTRELRLAEEHSRLILESSADGLYGVDVEGRTTFVNPAACAMLGYTPEQLLGRPSHEILHHSYADGRHYPMEDCPLHSTLLHGEVRRGDDESFWRADGTSLPVSYSSHPIRREGEIVGAVVSFIDVSTQKQAEAAREAALAEAEHLARVKSEFLANMSHEIRTPLNAVLGFAQIGVRESDPNKIRVFFQRILDSGQLLLGIINDILDFSKIEAGKLNINEAEVDLRAVIERSVDLLSTRAKDKGLRFSIEEDPNLPATFMGDDLRLSQVLANLLSNAVKFTDQGAVTFGIQREEGRLLFSVEDTGIGMREDYLANLFQPFEQADGSITRRYGGSGLGLAISKRLVELMGGEIHAWSRFGEGTRFETRLPLIEPRGVIGPSRLVTETATPEWTGARLRGIRLLAAEDNPANRLVLEEMLRAEDCDLTQVEDGCQAVACVEREGPTAFDLVLMDIQMPVMDGLEATQRIHQIAPELPVVGLTAHALNSERHLCLQAGMVDHIAKPVDIEQLIAIIVRHVRRPSLVKGKARATRSQERPVAPTRTDSPDANVTETVDTWIEWRALESRYAHNPNFIPRLLRAVLESNQDQANLLREAANQGDRDRLVFIAHRLKGTAGNLFAKSVHALATETEKRARALDIEAPRLALELADALDGLLAEIGASRWMGDAAETADDTASAPTTTDATEIATILARLASLLDTDDTEANPLYARHQDLLRRALGERVEHLGAEIKDFDYQAARETLRTLIESGTT
jgi:two-component system, sensor histidine kinase and response regulator